MIVVCRVCGSRVDPSFRFCVGCGADLHPALRCGDCGVEIGQGNLYCTDCGAKATVVRSSTRVDSFVATGNDRRGDESPVSEAASDRNVAIGRFAHLPLLPGNASPARDRKLRPIRDGGTTQGSSANRSSAVRLRRALKTLFARPGLDGFVSNVLANAQNLTSLHRFDEFATVENRTRIAIEVSVVALVSALGLFLRVANLESIPRGFEANEAELAVEAMRLLNGEWIGAWSTVQWGIPTGFIHWSALLFAVGEPDVFWARLASALPGAAMVPASYMLVRQFFPFRVAVLSAFMLAVSSWFLIQSRIGVPMVLAVAIATAAMWLAAETLRRDKTWVGLIGGAALGLGAYSSQAFLPYFVGIWMAVALAAAFSSTTRRSKSVRWFLALSFITAVPVLNHLFADGYIANRLATPYYGNVDVFDPIRFLSRIFELVMMVQNPMNTGTWDGTGGAPILHSDAVRIFYWLGLAIALLKIRQTPYLLLLAGWAIAATTGVFTFEAEARRYLFGIFFLLVFVSVGFNVFVQLLIAGALRLLDVGSTDKHGNRRYAIAAGTALIALFSVYAFSLDDGRFDEWSEGGVRWYFEEEYVAALRFLQRQDPDHQIRFYSMRRSHDSAAERFIVPDRIWIDGSSEFGGDGTVYSAGPVTQPTIYMLLDGYEDLIDDLRAAFPDGREHVGYDDRGRAAFHAFAVAEPQPP